jgi:hypothetical protein
MNLTGCSIIHASVIRIYYSFDPDKTENYLPDAKLNLERFSLPLRPAGLTRPAPAELPQDRKIARVGGCSGAM